MLIKLVGIDHCNATADDLIEIITSTRPSAIFLDATAATFANPAEHEVEFYQACSLTRILTFNLRNKVFFEGSMDIVPEETIDPAISNALYRLREREYQAKLLLHMINAGKQSGDTNHLVCVAPEAIHPFYKILKQQTGLIPEWETELLDPEQSNISEPSALFMKSISDFIGNNCEGLSKVIDPQWVVAAQNMIYEELFDEIRYSDERSAIVGKTAEEYRRYKNSKGKQTMKGELKPDCQKDDSKTEKASYIIMLELGHRVEKLCQQRNTDIPREHTRINVNLSAELRDYIRAIK